MHTPLRNMYTQGTQMGWQALTGRPQPTPGAAEAPSPEESGGARRPALLACLSLREHPALCHTGGRSCGSSPRPAPPAVTLPPGLLL